MLNSGIDRDEKIFQKTGDFQKRKSLIQQSRILASIIILQMFNNSKGIIEIFINNSQLQSIRTKLQKYVFLKKSKDTRLGICIFLHSDLTLQYTGKTKLNFKISYEIILEIKKLSR